MFGWMPWKELGDPTSVEPRAPGVAAVALFHSVNFKHPGMVTLVP